MQHVDTKNMCRKLVTDLESSNTQLILQDQQSQGNYLENKVKCLVQICQGVSKRKLK